MKKTIAVILMVAMILALTACGSAPVDSNVQQEITRATEAEDSLQPQEGYAFDYEGVTLVPGEAFDASKLPKADSVYEVPSCAIEGTDNVYSYGAFEITAFNDGSGEVIYSIYLMDAGVKTMEGLAVGDQEKQIAEIYGREHQGTGSEYLYVKGNTELHILVQDGAVLSIELRKGI